MHDECAQSEMMDFADRVDERGSTISWGSDDLDRHHLDCHLHFCAVVLAVPGYGKVHMAYSIPCREPYVVGTFLPAR